MSITQTPSGATIIVGRASVELARLLVLRSRLGLELKGLTFRGRTSYSILKRELGLRGSRQSVYDQLTVLLDTARTNPGSQEAQ